MADAEPQDSFMYFEPTGQVKGSSLDKELKSKNAFEITTFTFTGENATNIGSSTGGGGGAGKVKFEKLTFTKFTDSATVGLMLHMIEGVHTDKVYIVVRRNNVPYLKLTFHMCVVAALETSQSGDEEAEDDRLTGHGELGAVHSLEPLGSEREPDGLAEDRHDHEGHAEHDHEEGRIAPEDPELELRDGECGAHATTSVSSSSCRPVTARKTDSRSACSRSTDRIDDV